jgi:hypothetical protein
MSKDRLSSAIHLRFIRVRWGADLRCTHGGSRCLWLLLELLNLLNSLLVALIVTAIVHCGLGIDEIVTLLE